MINGKEIKFGYGDVAVGSGCNYISFESIKPPQEIGSDLLEKDIECLHDKITFSFIEHDLFLLKSKIKNITEENCIFEFEGYIFNFEKFNKKSVDVVLEGLNNTIKQSILPLAC